MTWWAGALVAVLGAFAAELAEMDLVRRRQGRLAWNRHKTSKANGQTYAPLHVYLIGIPIRLAAAGIVGGVYASAGQISGPIGAITLGAGASLFVSRISDQKDLGDLPHPDELPLDRSPRPRITKSRSSLRGIINLHDGDETSREAGKG